MLLIAVWVFIYSVTVAASVLFLGNPNTVLGQLSPKSLLSLLIDWRFLLGGLLALLARFIFVIINNLSSKQESLAHAHLSVTALASTLSIAFILLANYLFLDEKLSFMQLLGAGVIVLGVFLVFR